MHKDINDFVTTVFDATSTEMVWSATVLFFAQLGFENIVYGVRHPKSGSTPLTLRMTETLSDWKKVYLSHGDDTRDPLFNYGAQLASSFYTGPEFLSDHVYLNPEDLDVINRGAAFGLKSGLAFVMPCHDEKVVAGWNILTHFDRERALRVFGQFGRVMELAANISHREMVALDGIQVKNDKTLAPRQAECLTWLASGLRTNQIAEKMGIKPVTVELHLSNARDKLNAQTREQALAIAISDSLIEF